MANLGFQFDARQHEPAGIAAPQLPISGPEGLPVIISASEMKENSAKTGGFLEMTLSVIDGEHKGQTGVYRLNLFNQNQQTVEIAYKQLSAVCHAVGVFNIADSTQLHNIPFRVVTGLQKDAAAAEKGYTEVKGVLTINGGIPGKEAAAPVQQAAPTSPVFQQQAPPVNQQAAAPSASAAPPWSQQPAAGNASPPCGAK